MNSSSGSSSLRLSFILWYLSLALEKTNPRSEVFMCKYWVFLTAGLHAGRIAGCHADQINLPVLQLVARLSLPSPEEGAVYLEAPEAWSVEPDMAEGDAGKIEAGAEGKERSVEDSE